MSLYFAWKADCNKNVKQTTCCKCLHHIGELYLFMMQVVSLCLYQLWLPEKYNKSLIISYSVRDETVWLFNNMIYYTKIITAISIKSLRKCSKCTDTHLWLLLLLLFILILIFSLSQTFTGYVCISYAPGPLSCLFFNYPCSAHCWVPDSDVFR